MKERINILIAEGDKDLGLIMMSYLSECGFVTTLCNNGLEAVEKFRRKQFDLLILNVSTPIADGFAIAREVRKTDSQIPIIFISESSSEKDMMRSFSVGGDDFIVKPFNKNELVCRIYAVYRRSSRYKMKYTIIRFSSFTLDTVRHTLSHNGVEQRLTMRELELLYLLCERRNMLVERKDALQQIWSQNNVFCARNMDVYINKLRKLLKNDPDVSLVNVHGMGYKLIVRDEMAIP